MAIATLAIHLTLFAFGYNWWANYSYWMMANSFQIAVMHIMISKLSDETYNDYILERYWWVMWLLGVWNALCFTVGMGVGLLVYMFAQGMLKYLAVSVMTFEACSRIPLLICVVTAAICEEGKNFYVWEKY